MRKIRKLVAITVSFLVAGSVFWTNPCTYEAASTVKVSLLGKYDSADTATVRRVDTALKQIQFRNFDTGKSYTLSYDNTSYMYDEYGKAISAALLEEGEIVDITFLKSSKHLNSLDVSTEAFVINDVTQHDLIRGDETAKINGKIYHISPKTLIMADGKACLAENILDTDTVRVSGVGKELYSIVVTKGHGYVSLSSDVVGKTSLVGSWMELDNEVIKKITPNMLVSAPEGTYTLNIISDKTNYSAEVEVKRNRQTIIDTSDIPVEQPKEGTVTFEVSPENTKVYVDGDQIITGVPRSYEYGIHRVQAFAEGYESFDKNLKVAQEIAVLEIKLEKSDDAESESDSSNSISGSSSNSASSASTNTNSSTKGTSASNNAASASSNGAVTTNDKSISTAATAKASSNASSSNSASSTASSEDTSGAAYTYVTTDSESSTTSSTEDDDTVTTDDDSETTVKYQIFVDTPVSANIYVDGDFTGTIPAALNLTAGKHMITLQKEGYETKSYTVNIDESSDSVTYSFPDLVKEGETKSDSSSSSSSGSDSSSSSSTDNSSSTAGSSSDSTSNSSTESSSDSSSSASTSSDSSVSGNNLSSN
ncbi:MAG: PEGA domain-containing protein [Butyrivibrio sp.]|nr:PEGA domain-containing protein [Butyrivibrio sp.]